MSIDHLASALREHPFLKGFRPDSIDRMAAMSSELSFGAGELIFHEGDESSFFYLLLSGRVAVELVTPGNRVRIATLGPGEALGWSSILPSPGKQFQGRSLEEVRAIAFDGTRLRHACEEDYAFGCALLRALLRVAASRLEATRAQLLDVYSPVA
jgi:CRP-like cAMP-binding protein